MSNIIQKIREIFFEKAQPLKPGLYNYQAPPESDFPYRLHLRVEQNGEGILIINASTVLHLNQTAAEFAYHIVQQHSKAETLEATIKRYDINLQQAAQDFEDFKQRIDTMINMPDLDPILYLNLERRDPYDHVPVAPYRLDCALTYQLFSSDEDILTPIDRVKRELSFSEWQQILKKAWDAGIPHVIFTGGEPTIRPDLPDLIAEAERLGQVTGVLTNGIRLAEKDYLETLLQSGLDHLLIMLDPDHNTSWEAIRDVMPEDIQTTVHITVTEENALEFPEILRKLHEMSVEDLSLSSKDLKLKEKVQELRDQAADMGFNLIWDLPVPYSRFNPIAFETGAESTNEAGAGIGWLYVEPDGDVLPSQGDNQVMGNLLEDDWQKIWQKTKEVVIKQREN